MTTRLTNWAGNVEFGPRAFHRPASLPDLRRVVSAAAAVRVLGSGHSFTRIADTSGDLVSLDALPPLIEIDTAGARVRVGGGTRYSDLCAALRGSGLALPNLPSTPHFTVAGACATGTHGSGTAHGTLATSVSSLDLVLADGSSATLARGSDDFGGAVTSLGALGVATALTLDLCPAFEVEQYVHDALPWPVLLDHVDDLLGAAYSVSVFTDWSDAVRLWVKRRVGDPLPDLGWTGARPADGPRHPIDGMPTVNTTGQLGVPGPWDDRLPHFRAGHLPSAGVELQSEYLLPRARSADALAALRDLRPVLAPVLQISEIRSVAADDCWIGPSHGRDSLAVHFTWVRDASAVAPVLLRVEEALAPFDARPHWGKLSSTAPDRLATSYARWDDFRRLLRRFDPSGTFRNPLIDHYFPHPAD